MKKILIVAAAVALIGAGCMQSTNKELETADEMTAQTTELSFVSCEDSLYYADRVKYDFWKSVFTDLYPELRVYDAGAYCELSDGTQLISFSHFQGAGNIDDAFQTIVLFDEADNVINATQGFRCDTIGDLGYPVFDSLEDDIVSMSCHSGDAGRSLHLYYELDLNTFDMPHILR